MAFLDQRLKGGSRYKIPQPSTYNRRFLWKVICIWLQATKSSALYVDIEQALTLSQKDQQSFLLIKQSTQSSSLSFQDAHEETSPESQLHLRKNLPKTISNCQGKCGKAITANEIPIVKPFGERSWTCRRSGQEKQKYGSIYLHFKYSEEFWWNAHACSWRKLKFSAYQDWRKHNICTYEKTSLESLGIQWRLIYYLVNSLGTFYIPLGEKCPNTDQR